MATTVLEDVREDLAADATLTATATGAIILVSNTSTDKGVLNWTDTPSAYDKTGNVNKLKPSIVLAPSTEGPGGPRGAMRSMIFRINYYAPEGYTTIETMRLRVKALLHDIWRKLDDGSNYRTALMDTRDGLVDSDIVTGFKRPASLAFDRYMIDTGS